MQTDIELIKGIQSGDNSAFTELDNRYRPILFGYLARHIQNVEEAVDLTQDTLIKLWENISIYDPAKGSVSAWVMKIGYRVLLDFVRKQKRIVHGGRLSRTSLEYAQPSETDEYELERIEQAETAADMISSLLRKRGRLSSEAETFLMAHTGLSVEEVRDAFYAAKQRMSNSRHREKIKSMRKDLRTPGNLEKAAQAIPRQVQMVFW